ncbi:MAG: hypothetical protein P8R54_32070 [Myxococcota bacterium]|nr:hypothetical protein [Myxococcota bacterium]
MNAPIHTGLALSDRATPADVLATINEGIDAALRAGEPAWTGATGALIARCVSLDACFSSGEVSAWIRTYRPDIRFSVTRNVGPYIRALFSSGALPHYSAGPVEKQRRETAGYSNAPVHTAVFVYGPGSFAIATHRFEVIVPASGTAMPDLRSLPAMPIQSATPTQPVLTAAPRAQQGSPAVGRAVLCFSGAPTATVHTDRRLCVPRRAFEALAGCQRRTVHGGDDVYVAIRGDEIVISLDPLQDSRRYALVSSRCRLLFTTALPIGAHYAIAITVDGLRLDMSSAL